MKIKNVFLISIVLLAIFSISAVSAESIADENVEIISGDFNSNNDFGNVLSNYNLDDSYGAGESEDGDDSINNASSIESSDLVKYYRNDSQYEATFYDADGNPLVNESIPISINGANYNRTTNTSGIMKFSINLAPGDYVIKVTNPVTNESASNNVTVLSTLISNDVVKYYKNGTQYYITVLNGQGNALTNATVSLNINGVFYNRTTDKNGIAQLKINLNSGKYVITAEGPDGLKVSNNITVKPTIEGKDIKKYYKNGTQYYANFTDAEGNPLANTNVTFNINGVMYNRKTDANGTAKLSINLPAGKYVLTAINPNTTEQMSNNVEVLSKIAVKNSQSGGNISMEYNSSSKYSVTLYNDDGTLAKNKAITFNINGVFYKRTSDENGTASLTINLRPGDYVITGDFEGCKQSNLIKVRVTPNIKLVSSTLHFNESFKFYLTEKNSGNPITGEHYGIFIYNNTPYGALPDINGLVEISQKFIGQTFPVGFSDMFYFGMLDDGYYSSIWVLNTVKIVE
ncbi:MAG: adhesin [Methanobrevibacter sp.]|nr:adhesin [Methanobrevibacter sp.]